MMDKERGNDSDLYVPDLPEVKVDAAFGSMSEVKSSYSDDVTVSEMSDEMYVSYEAEVAVKPVEISVDEPDAGMYVDADIASDAAAGTVAPAIATVAASASASTVTVKAAATAPATAAADDEAGCKSCGSMAVEEHYAFPLCERCRNAFAARPLPAWIKVSAVIVGIIVVIASVNLPRSMDAGIAYERGQKAERAHKYQTAVTNYRKALERFPESKDIQASLFMAQCNNAQVEDACNSYKLLVGKSFDEKQCNEMEALFEKTMSLYFPEKELSELLEQNKNASGENIVALLRTYLQKNPQDACAKYYLANQLYDMGKYGEVQTLMQELLGARPDHLAGYLLQAAAYRECKEYDTAMECCQKSLLIDKDYPAAYAAMARIELKRHNDPAALETAQKAYQLNQDIDTTFTLALACHYNNLPQKRDDMARLLNTYTGAETDIQLLTGAIDGSKPWRE